MNLKTLLAIFLFLTISVDSKFVLKRNDNIYYQNLKTSQVKPFHFSLDDFDPEKITVNEMYFYQIFIKLDKNYVLFMKGERNTNPNIIEKGDYVLFVNGNMKMFYFVTFNYGDTSEPYLQYVLNQMTIEYEKNKTSPRKRFFVQFEKFNNDMEPKMIHFNLSSNQDILKKMKTTNNQKLLPDLPEVENDFLSLEIDVESTRKFFDFTIKSHLNGIFLDFQKTLTNDKLKTLRNIYEESLGVNISGDYNSHVSGIIETLLQTNLIKDYTPIFTPEIILKLFTSVMDNQEFNLMVDACNFLYENRSDRRLYFK